MGRIRLHAKQEAAEQLDVCAFGGLTIYYQGSPITVLWESQKARLLFSYLLVTYDQWVHRDKLIELLWPGCEVAAGTNNFKTTLSRLRKSFAGPRVLNPVLVQGEAVRINFQAISLDASRFRQNALNGVKMQLRGETKLARPCLETAQDLYTGEFLPEEPFNPFITAARNELSDLYDHVVKSLERIYRQEGNEEAVAAMLLLQKNLSPVLA